MNKEHLQKIIYHSIGLVWNEAWEDVIYKQDDKVPVREQDLYKVVYGQKSGYLTFDYRVLGLEFVKGSVCGSGVSIDFKLSPYERINITVGYSISEGLYNHVLITPKYEPEHYDGRKKISQVANIVRNEKEFIRYRKKIDKRFKLDGK